MSAIEQKQAAQMIEVKTWFLLSRNATPCSYTKPLQILCLYAPSTLLAKDFPCEQESLQTLQLFLKQTKNEISAPSGNEHLYHFLQ
jgi:hypothetical protein